MHDTRLRARRRLTFLRLQRGSLRTPLAMVTAVALALGGAVAVVGAPVPAAAATGDVRGTVFRDFNGNGVRDTGNAAGSGVANDVGLAGVAVTVTDGRGAVLAQGATSSDGTYALPTNRPDGTPVRVQFSSWPSGYQPSGTEGQNATNGTSLQFVASGATNVDLALNKPGDYSQDVPPLLTAIQRAGDPARATDASEWSTGPAVAGTLYDDNGVSTQNGFPGRVTLATFHEVGAVSALVYQKSTNSAYALAVYKRESGLGPQGLGGLYRISNVLDASGAPSSAGTVTGFDVRTLGVDLGTAQSNGDRGLAGPQDPSRDPDAFAKAGKIGFGGAAISADGTTLYFVNLNDKRLYALDISDPSRTPTLKGSWSLGLTVGQRPWAVYIDDGTVFVGYSETGENAQGAQPGIAAATANLHAGVLAAPLSGFGTATWTRVLDVPLGYTKGQVADWATSANSNRWNTWTDTWRWNGGSVIAATTWQIYPQPILSGIFRDEDGYLTLSFADRTAIQGGNRNLSSDTGGQLYETGSGGDLLMASPRSDGTFTLEANGRAGARQTQFGAGGEGPGGSEFYDDSNNLGTGGHHENSLGAVVGQRGTREVVDSTFDPLDRVRLSGLNWFSIDSGRSARGYELTADGGFGADPAGTFQKGGGLGSVALLAADAPVEIGNRVWLDADQNGIQDADEPAIQGVTVQLFAQGGSTPIATQTTDVHGQYFFRSDRDGFDPKGTYTVRFVKPSTGTMTLTGPNASSFGAIGWSQTSFTRVGGSATTGSAADPASGAATVVLRGPGMNVDDIDAGFVANRSIDVTKAIDPSGGAPAAGQTFPIQVAARDFRGDPITLPQSSFQIAPGATSPDIPVPVGAAVQVTENDPSTKSAAITDPSGNPHTGWYTVQGTGSTMTFRVTDTLYKPGSIEVDKAVTGDFSLASPQLDAAVFTVDYAYTGGSGTLTLNKANGWKSATGPLPYGAQVTLTESSRTGQGASVGYGTQTWSTGGQSDGTAKITVGDGTTTAVTLTNPTTTRVGGFSVTKSVTGPAASRVPAGTTFTVEYSTDNGTTWTALAPIADGATASGPANVAAGTTVLLREDPRPTLADVAWQTPVFSGTGVTPHADGTASLVVAAGATAAVALQNPTAPRNGQFSITKDVTGPGATLVSGDPDYTVGYTSSRGSGTLTVKNGATISSPALPTGTVVTLTEVAPTGGLPAGAAWGTPVLHVGGRSQANGSTITIGDATVVAVTVENPTTVTPSVAIRKGDGDAGAGTIAHEADTVADGQTYLPGETRDIVIRVANTGPEALRDVVVTDQTLSGAAVTNLVWTAPDGTVLTPVANGATTTARWDQTFGAGGASWKPGDVIVGRATLTAGAAGSAPHQDRATVAGTGVLSGTAVSAHNDYNAFTGGIQVIEYDGQKSDPAVKDASGTNWITPAKPLLDPAQDANSAQTAVDLPVDTARPVRWVVTNTGTTWLTNVTLTDTTQTGAAIGADWTADLSSVGGPKDYSFTTSGPWKGALAPGASFFASGTLKMPAHSTHADRVDVVGTVVVPAADADGVPTGRPATAGGAPVAAKKADGSAFTVADADPFNARTGIGPVVEIRKGDGTGTTIVHEADTAATAEAYQPGETRTIVFRAGNTGDEPLVDVTLTDRTLAGGQARSLVWTLPDGSSLPATWDAAAQSWTATWSGPWAPGTVVTGTAQLTLGSASPSHVDRAVVDARGQASGKAVTSSNDYHAFTGGTQVIKYDGQEADPVVKAASGWVLPTKPLVDAAQDADDAAHAVVYPVRKAEKVRWVVSNAGSTWLTDLMVKTTDLAGPAVGSDWTADLSAFGGPKDYSFVKSGPWTGALPPGASFFAQGTLALAA